MSQFSTHLFFALLVIPLVAFLEIQCLDIAGSEERRESIREVEEQTDQEIEELKNHMTGKTEVTENLTKNDLMRKTNQSDAVGGNEEWKTEDDGDRLSDAVVRMKKMNRITEKNNKLIGGLKNGVQGKKHTTVKKIKVKKAKGKPTKTKKRKTPGDNKAGNKKETRKNEPGQGGKGAKGNKGKGDEQQSDTKTSSSEKSRKGITTSKDHPVFSFSNYLLAECGKTYKLVPGTSYLFTTDGAQVSRNCRVKILSPPGTTIQFYCPVFNLHMKKCKKESLLLTETKKVKWSFCKTDVVNIETTGPQLQVHHKRRRLPKKKCPGAFLCEITVHPKHGPVTAKPPATMKPHPTHPVPVTDPYPIRPTPGPIYTTKPPTGGKPPAPIQHRPFCYNCNQGTIIVNRIVGGVAAIEGEFVYQVRIMVHGKILCSGSLLSRTIVLSAAHCFSSGYENSIAILGEYDTTINEYYTQEISVVNVIKHEDFNSRNMDNDIAIVELSRPAVISNYVKPICIATSKDTYPSSLTVTSGWGHTKYGGSTSTYLRKVGLDLITNEECQQMYNERGYTITSNMVCTYTQSKDACQGDSGGPLVRQTSDGVWVLFGIVSFGYQCAYHLSPGVFTNVAVYEDWISRNIYNLDC